MSAGPCRSARGLPAVAAPCAQHPTAWASSGLALLVSLWHGPAEDILESPTAGTSPPVRGGDSRLCLGSRPPTSWLPSVPHAPSSQRLKQSTTKRNQDGGGRVPFIFSRLFPQMKGKKPPVAAGGAAGRGKALGGQQKRADLAAGVRRTPSSKCGPGCAAGGGAQADTGLSSLAGWQKGDSFCPCFDGSCTCKENQSWP